MLTFANLVLESVLTPTYRFYGICCGIRLIRIQERRRRRAFPLHMTMMKVNKNIICDFLLVRFICTVSFRLSESRNLTSRLTHTISFPMRMQSAQLNPSSLSSILECSQALGRERERESPSLPH
jgi:hypothetical protein